VHRHGVIESPALMEEFQRERQRRLRIAPGCELRLEADRLIAIVIQMLQRAGQVAARVRERFGRALLGQGIDIFGPERRGRDGCERRPLRRTRAGSVKIGLVREMMASEVDSTK
jgi:hypothetical protein